MKAIVDNQIIDMSLVYKISPIKKGCLHESFTLYFYNQKELTVCAGIERKLLDKFKDVTRHELITFSLVHEGIGDYKVRNFRNIAGEYYVLLERFTKTYEDLVKFWCKTEKIALPMFNFEEE